MLMERSNGEDKGNAEEREEILETKSLVGQKDRLPMYK